MTKKKNKFFLLALSLAAASLFTAQPAFAADDFGKIVHHIEVSYHTHRHYRWAMGLAGFTVKFWHVGGVKNFKGAIFENSDFAGNGSDKRLDEVVRAAMDSGWQPMVQSYDRHSGERTYIYAQYLGKDMKVLLVNLEQEEAVVIQVKINPDKLSDFVKEASSSHGGRNRPAHDEPMQADNVELASLETHAAPWDGICLLTKEAGPQPTTSAFKIESRL
jgi:hypothetical protein